VTVVTSATHPARVLAHHAAEHPTDPAIVSLGFVMTYGELADAVRRVAARLRSLGIRPGQVVGIRARPEWEAVLALAVLHEGACSLHASDAVLAAYGDRLDHVLLDGIRPGTRRAIDVGTAFLETLGSVNAAIDPQPIAPDAACRIVFSSGTTGTPKGVAFTLAMLLARTDAAHTNWMPAEPFFCLLGIDTVSGYQTFMWSVLHGRPWIVPGTGAANLDLLGRTQARAIKTSPARLADLLDAVDARGAAPHASPVPRLEHVQVAGALLSGPLARRAEHLLGIIPTYLYGSTECGTITRGDVDPHDPARVGWLVEGSELQVVDEHGVVAATGEVGSVRYRTPTTPSSYWNGDPNADRAFRDGWFWPGDRGSLGPDGALHLAGRDDDVVNASGAKINLAELDLWLAELDLLDDLATFAYPDADGTMRVGLVYVPRHDAPPEIVHDAVRRRAPFVEVTALIRVDVVPRNARGKVTRPSLLRLLGNQ
jgi:acyl-coenzyme A synthetase/AMP-(fatty) acid ligase